MHDVSSFQKIRLVWSQGSKAMSEAIGFEIRTICRRAAEPLQAGENVKAQMRRAWENLSRPPFWRLRSGWYGEGGAWSAAAVKDFQSRYLDLVERKRRQAEHRKTIEAMTRPPGPPATLELARDELRSLYARIEAIEIALRVRP